MTDIEQKARDTARREDKHGTLNYDAVFTALCRAIEQHEAFKREVSDAVEAVLDRYYVLNIEDILSQFIIPAPKPDTLVEVLNEISHEGGFDNFNHYAHRLRAALEARGLEIREKTMTEYGRIHTDGSRSGGQPVIKTEAMDNLIAQDADLIEMTNERLRQSIEQLTKDPAAEWQAGYEDGVEHERAKIVAYARGHGGNAWSKDVLYFAEKVEAGEHLK